MTQAIQTAEALVVDASVAAIWHLPGEPYVEQAFRLLARHRRGETEFTAPTHILYEIPSAITAATRRQPARLTSGEGRAQIDAFLQLGIRTVDDGGLPREAYEFALQTGVAFYDGLYGALSRRLAIPLVLADRQFYVRARPFVDAVWIADLP